MTPLVCPLCGAGPSRHVLEMIIPFSALCRFETFLEVATGLLWVRMLWFPEMICHERMPVVASSCSCLPLFRGLFENEALRSGFQ